MIDGSPVPSSRPARPSSRYESLDAWRGITCLAVIVYHSTIFGAEAQPPEALLSVGGALLFVREQMLLWRDALLRHQRLLHRGGSRCQRAARNADCQLLLAALPPNLSAVLGQIASIDPIERAAGQRIVLLPVGRCPAWKPEPVQTARWLIRG